MKLNKYLIRRSKFATDLVLSLIFSIVLFSPLLFSAKPWLLFSGDLHNLYFPQFIRGYYLAKSHVWYGVDLLTNNGASAYFLRPNIPTYYPPHIIIYKLFELDGIVQFSRAFVWSLCIHAMLAFYSIIKLSKRFLKFNIWYALILAVSYVFTIAKSNELTPFYYVAALFPAIIYLSLTLLRNKSWKLGLISSAAYVCVFLSGYLPLAIHSVVLSLVVVLAIKWLQEDGKLRTYNIDFAIAVSPVALAAIIVFPLYLAILNYHKLVTGIPDGVWGAHEFWYQLPDLLSLLSAGFMPLTQVETPHVVIGLLPLFIIALTLTVRSISTVDEEGNRLVVFALAIFGFHVILAAGKSTGLPDVFYYLVPGLGKMHLYGRYLITSSFLVFLASSLLLKKLIESPERLNYRCILLVLILFICTFYVVGRFVELSNIHLDQLIMELLFLGIFIIILSSKSSRAPVVWALFAVTLVKLGSFNSIYNTTTPANPPAYANALVFSTEREQALLNYARQNSESKEVVKYADLTTSIDKPNGVLLNFPWVVQAGIPLSNYMGYELHLSVDKDYLRGFPWFGKVDFSWMQKTGVDFFIVDAQAKQNYSEELERYADRAIPVSDLGFGIELIRAKKNTLSAGVTISNGVFSILSNDSSFEVGKLEGDFSSYLAFDVRSKSPIEIRYLFFPNKLMQFRVDGNVLELAGAADLAHFELAPGQHRVEYVYKEQLNKGFVFMLRGYFYLLLFVLALVALGFLCRTFKSLRG